MCKRELKYNLKSFLIWLGIIIAMFLVVFLVYPSIANSENIKSIDQMMEIFPKELLEAFNMDITSMSTAYGWLKSEGFIFILLIICCYAGITGSNIILKEESDKTIEYLNSMPVSRNKIFISKYFVGIIYITLLVILTGLFNYICLKLSGDLNTKEYILLSITPLFPAYVTYGICIFISNFMHKTKKVLALSLGIVFMSYILNTLSQISDSVEFLKYTSPFTLADTRNVILNTKISPVMIIITIIITLILYISTNICYNKKEFL